ncbi:hypothetical protein EJ06DRAFT_531613 [Trichodelitschia bisporula]|uniref:Uncharacterized protein n=1 Tax=Trichodelitschia bisporula TaxID=703511 RepID=A0A6G1HTG0_9PEZI|nr:hypothetical protein EJ06DRAFT_531613 [Trichodelitschia bisporula]
MLLIKSVQTPHSLRKAPPAQPTVHPSSHDVPDAFCSTPPPPVPQAFSNSPHPPSATSPTSPHAPPPPHQQT